MNTNRLRELRKKHNLTQSDMGMILGFSRQRYNFYETGKRQVDNETLVKLAEFFRTTTDYLLGKTDNPTLPDAKKETPGHIIPEAVMEAAERQKGRPLTAEERAELLIRTKDLMATLVRIKRESE